MGEDGNTLTYPAKTNKYIGSLFNFIYIPRRINGDLLGNLVMPAKIEILTKKGKAYDVLNSDKRRLLDENPVKCKYSQWIISTLSELNPEKEHKYFSNYWKYYEENDSEKMRAYFSQGYIDDYTCFMKRVLDEFSYKFKNI